MNQKRNLGILEVKQAFLSDSRFRELFPELQEQMDKALRDPGCACNRKLYDKFFEYPDRLKKYFPNREVISLQQQVETISANQWTVINCKCAELEVKLRKLFPHGRKQLEVARWQDECTAVVNELDIVW